MPALRCSCAARPDARTPLGPTDAAGGFADANFVRRAEASGVNPMALLDNSDSYALLDATDDLLRTGLTGTNVMDVYVVLIAAVPGC